MQNTKSRDTKRGDDHDGRSQLDQTMLQVYTGLDGVYTRYPNEARAHCEYWDGWSLDCLGQQLSLRKSTDEIFYVLGGDLEIRSLGEECVIDTSLKIKIRTNKQLIDLGDLFSF